MEMTPLNFSSTRSQMILLSKYWTGSHCREGEEGHHHGVHTLSWKPIPHFPQCQGTQARTDRNAFCLILLLFRL